MIIFFQEIMMLLFLWLLKLIDGIMEIFSAIAGIGTVSYQGRQVNILELLIGDSSVGTVFWCVMILAVGLTCIFAIVALIKNMITNNKQVSGIMGKFFLALLGTLAMLAVVVLGVLISNAVLKLVSEIFMLNGDTKLSSALFNACVGNWKKGHSISEFNTNLSVRSIFGSYKKILGIWPDEWKGNGMIDPDSFMYLPALVGSIGLLIALIIACINLAKRIYEIVLLYLVMPVSMSTLPLDDGARFKIWRETFITKIILAYGTVFAVNLFILLLPIITQMRITGASSFANSVFFIFMLVGGAVVIPAAQQLFAKLFGSGDDNGSGSSMFRSGMHGARMTAAAAFGVTMGVLKGGGKLGKKIFGKHGKGGGGSGGSGGGKGDSEKFSEENKSSGSSDSSDSGSESSASSSDSNTSSEKHDNTDSEKLENQSGSTSTEGNNDMAGAFESGNSKTSANSTDSKLSSEDTSQDKMNILDGAFENGNAKSTAISSGSSDSKTSSEKRENTDSEKLENQSGGTSTEGNNDMAGAFESGNSKTSANSTDNQAVKSNADSQTSTTNTDTQSVTASADSGKFTDSQPSTASTDGASAAESTDAKPSTVNAGGNSATESTDSAKFTDNQSSTASTDNTSAAVSTDSKQSAQSTDSGKFTDSQSSAASVDSQTSTTNTDTQSVTASADSKTSAVSTDIKPSAANPDNGKYSENSMSAASADSKPSAASTDSKTSSVSTESSKYSDSQSAATSTDIKSSTVNTESKILSENPDSRKHSENKSTDNKPSAVKTESKPLSESTDSGKFTDNQDTTASTDDTGTGGKFE